MNDRVETFDDILMPWGCIDDMTPFTDRDNDANAIFGDFAFRDQDEVGIPPGIMMNERPYSMDESVIEKFGDRHSVTTNIY